MTDAAISQSMYGVVLLQFEVGHPRDQQPDSEQWNIDPRKNCRKFFPLTQHLPKTPPHTQVSQRYAKYDMSCLAALDFKHT